MNIVNIIAKELQVKNTQVEAAIQLLHDGATVPFIARYRKEATGGLDDEQLRLLAERLQYLEALQDRQQAILKSIDEQGKLTPELQKTILATETKTRLEDLYAPYKPKRRTKAQIAREAGLEPLAAALLSDINLSPEDEAQQYLNKDIADTNQALEGAKQIIMEWFSENADLLEALRQLLWQHGYLFSQVAPDKSSQTCKFKDYYDFHEAISTIPSHRLLAIFRGRKEQILQARINFIDETMLEQCFQCIAKAFHITLKPHSTHWLSQVIIWAWKVKLHLKLELELMMSLKNRADEEAIKVFNGNLKNLLMAAPAGNIVVLGLDPGYRTGVKTVVVDGTGKLLDHDVIFPHQPQKQWDKALNVLSQLCHKHQVKLISIGNGTASRETDELASELIKLNSNLNMTKIIVSEAGASVYSASALASQEFPDLDVSYRGAVSIARRLQDPLAELVKIEPKSIGVGQYQHDVNQTQLSRALGEAIEDCVNAVGADINTGSVPLLASISGLNESIAKNIVQYRETHGRFTDRQQLKSIPRLGEKTFEQAAGFLRIIDGNNPLDRSAVHPESYHLVEQIAKSAKLSIKHLIGDHHLIDQLDPAQFVTKQAGLPTIRDIFDELKKPGRDPRPEFKTAIFADGIHQVSDLKAGMKLEGVITNVANFGAFVDIGVHQDGLVHISEIADHFVEDLHREVKVGQIVTVTVVEIDEKRNRIGLSMKNNTQKRQPTKKQPEKEVPQNVNGLLANKLRDALKN